ncbi:hypothetical protein RUM43_010865 [Polyplax serrata]|uniref:Uncharacterized protein n=1 Tax=Polyplax serrata TaxID=468196 RepID=A0AAN8P445_POLSC
MSPRENRVLRKDRSGWRKSDENRTKARINKVYGQMGSKRRTTFVPEIGLLFVFFVISLALLILCTDIVSSSNTIETKRFIHLGDTDSSNAHLSGEQTFESKQTDFQILRNENFSVGMNVPSNNNHMDSKMERRIDDLFGGNESKNSYELRNETVFGNRLTNFTHPTKGQNRPLGSFKGQPEVASLGTPSSGARDENNEKMDNQRKGDYHAHEINELMQSRSKKIVEDIDRDEIHKYKNRGSPFQRSVTVESTKCSDGISFIHCAVQLSESAEDGGGRLGPEFYPPPRSTSSNYWTKASHPPVSIKKKPLTLLMDIYPMKEHDESRVTIGQQKKFHYKKNPRGNILYIPIKSKAGFTESMLSRLIGPRENQNRMLIKLNLYPSEKKVYGTLDHTNEGEVYVGRKRMRYGRRTSPSVSKQQKKKIRKKQSSIACYNTGSGNSGQKFQNSKKFVSTVRYG